MKALFKYLGIALLVLIIEIIISGIDSLAALL